MALPLVSVIIPVYNGGPYITETLESALSQTYGNTEIIVIDDGSTDDSPQRLERYRSSIKYVRQENAGVGAARNAGLDVARGEYIAFLDQDDLWLPEKLDIQVGVATEHSESGMIACDGIHFDGDRILLEGLLWGPVAERLASSFENTITGLFYREFIQQTPISCPAQTLIPREVTLAVGPVTTSREESEDWDYTLRIALKYPITLHRHALVRWRYLASSGSGALERRRFVWTLRQIPVLRRHGRLGSVKDRPVVIETLRKLARQRSREAYQYGRTQDMRYARVFLAKLSRLVPEEPVVVACLLKAWLPERVINVAGRVRRRMARRGGVANGS